MSTDIRITYSYCGSLIKLFPSRPWSDILGIRMKQHSRILNFSKVVKIFVLNIGFTSLRVHSYTSIPYEPFTFYRLLNYEGKWRSMYIAVDC